uniref:Uncharacterized protein n=1 Tax=Aegilops tauschii subsp. strangulata TaxID=200361 RepID=A0A453GC78_AEGTS
MGIQPNLLNQLVSLLLGASVAGVLIFFMSSDGIGAGPSTPGISSWVNGTMAVPVAPAQEANHTSASKVDAYLNVWPGPAGGGGRAGAAAADGGGRAQDGDHDVGERGVGGGGLAAGPLPRELPRRGADRALRGPPPRRGPRRRGAGAVPGRAPALLPPATRGRRQQEPLGREGVHEQGLPGPGLEQGPAAAKDPRARIQLPLHGRGHHVVPGPIRADVGGGAHGGLVGLLLRRPVQPRERPEHGVPVREVERAHGGRLRGVADGEAVVPGEARAAGVQRDQVRAGRQAWPPGAVPRHGAQRRVLQQHPGFQHALHHARQLLRWPRRQAPRPREPDEGVARVPGDGRRAAPPRPRAVEGPRDMHPL